MVSREEGFRVHLGNALREGLTGAEALHALELCFMGGSHHITDMFPVVADEVKKFKERQS